MLTPAPCFVLQNVLNMLYFQFIGVKANSGTLIVSPSPTVNRSMLLFIKISSLIRKFHERRSKGII